MSYHDHDYEFRKTQYVTPTVTIKPKKDEVIHKANVLKSFTNKIQGDIQVLENILIYKYNSNPNLYDTKVIEYLERVNNHKYEVYKAGEFLMKQGWFNNFSINKEDFKYNLWTHDLSKYSDNEINGYVNHDFKSKEYDLNFEIAWHHHKMNNHHHPEFYLNPNRSGELDVLPIPNIYLFEMVADWIGAGKTYGSSLEKWLPDNLHKFLFHKNTQLQLQLILKYLGIETEIKNNRLYTV